MNIIATWICLDKKGEESNYPQVRGKSTDLTFQEVYWRCVITFFSSSLRFNKNARHILFTNANEIPKIRGFNLKVYLLENNVEIIKVQNEYIVPRGYYSSWNNQFYEFSILKYLFKNINTEYKILILDSDCIFNSSVDYLFKKLEHDRASAFTYQINYPENHNINGLTRIQMQKIFNEVGLKMKTPPIYSGGEVLFAKDSFICNLCEDFINIWEEQIKRFREGNIKFNEEAHALSYYYYKFNADIGRLNPIIKRCWTNPLSYRNICDEDNQLNILHLPAEKNNGLKKIFRLIAEKKVNIQNISETEYEKLVLELISPKRYYFSLKNWMSFFIKTLPNI